MLVVLLFLYSVSHFLLFLMKKLDFIIDLISCVRGCGILIFMFRNALRFIVIIFVCVCVFFFFKIALVVHMLGGDPMSGHL